VVALVATLGEARADAPMFDLGAWLVERRGLIDGSEAAWLDVLAEFDAHGDWAADGQLSGAEWLMWRTKMARSTAFEKLRIAHELRRRPAVAAAFAAGEISYSAVRAITRLEDTSPEVDEALVVVARDSSVLGLEEAIRRYRLNHDQDRPLGPWQRRHDRRGVCLDRGYSGIGSAEIRLSSVELEELHVTLDAFLDRGAPVDESSRADSEGGPTSWAERRADAFMELVRTGLAHAQEGAAVGADRYLVHAVVDVSGQASATASVRSWSASCATAAWWPMSRWGASPWISGARPRCGTGLSAGPSPCATGAGAASRAVSAASSTSTTCAGGPRGVAPTSAMAACAVLATTPCSTPASTQKATPTTSSSSTAPTAR